MVGTWAPVSILYFNRPGVFTFPLSEVILFPELFK